MEITIPASVTSIGEYAFTQCTFLSSVTFQGAISRIPAHCFESCSSLETVVLPNAGTVTIGEGAFLDCPCEANFAS
jgi:hypothetical protein